MTTTHISSPAIMIVWYMDPKSFKRHLVLKGHEVPKCSVCVQPESLSTGGWKALSPWWLVVEAWVFQRVVTNMSGLWTCESTVLRPRRSCATPKDKPEGHPALSCHIPTFLAKKCPGQVVESQPLPPKPKPICSTKPTTRSQKSTYNSMVQSISYGVYSIWCIVHGL